ncbi:unnamed protein product [Didymodactylos carnosus]|uniref:SGNH hydrolase-type esterase domain-containing protein n=1 Tax=Didymodactylos carnosus TaxID=1234261 RepID=A0A814CXK6_9BILA|nr:unnamed protein product [Didymodactylos carnosus]CAF0946434.1 unnamed protein product [Didymodactylos carnosus]CAF3698221.1 unnamed protein product [Didymodactylos carnosus]CAF3722573.1 unnamed protein product [Didymodactylos carnosus]
MMDTSGDINSSTAAIPAIPNDAGDGRWMAIFWKDFFEPLHCLNFGIGEDQTQNVLWRTINGEMDICHPQCVVLLVGTQNYQNSADEVAHGILEIVRVIEQKQPKTVIVVLAIPPRGQKPNPVREKITQINSIVEQQMKQTYPKHVFLHTCSNFVQEDGLISHLDMNDYLHFTNDGYEKFLDPLLEKLQQILKYNRADELLSSASSTNLAEQSRTTISKSKS